MPQWSQNFVSQLKINKNTRKTVTTSNRNTPRFYLWYFRENGITLTVFTIFLLRLFIVCDHVRVGAWMHARGHPTGVSPFTLWVQGTEPRSSDLVAGALILPDMSPSPSVFFEKGSHYASKIGGNFLWFSCLHFPRARVIAVCHQAQHSVLSSYWPEKLNCVENLIPRS